VVQASFGPATRRAGALESRIGQSACRVPEAATSAKDAVTPRTSGAHGADIAPALPIIRPRQNQWVRPQGVEHFGSSPAPGRAGM